MKSRKRRSHNLNPFESSRPITYLVSYQETLSLIRAKRCQSFPLFFFVPDKNLFLNDTIISNVDQRKLLNYWFPMVLSKIMLFAHSNVWADELHFSIECNVKILDKILLTFETKRHHSARSPILQCNQMK